MWQTITTLDIAFKNFTRMSFVATITWLLLLLIQFFCIVFAQTTSGQFPKDIDCFIDNSFIGAKNVAVANFAKQHSFCTIPCIFVHLSGRFVQEFLETSKLHPHKLCNKRYSLDFGGIGISLWGLLDTIMNHF